MHISADARSKHTITAYDDTQIKINDTIYKESMIVSATTIDIPWEKATTELLPAALAPIIELNPEVVLIGYDGKRTTLPAESIQLLTKAGIGIELMSIGAACRTFNVLLSEGRQVVLGVIFQ